MNKGYVVKLCIKCLQSIEDCICDLVESCFSETWEFPLNAYFGMLLSCSAFKGERYVH